MQFVCFQAQVHITVLFRKKNNLSQLPATVSQCLKKKSNGSPLQNWQWIVETLTDIEGHVHKESGLSRSMMQNTISSQMKPVPSSVGYFSFCYESGKKTLWESTNEMYSTSSALAIVNPMWLSKENSRRKNSYMRTDGCFKCHSWLSVNK